MAKRNKGINIFHNVPKASPNRTQFPIFHKCDFSGDFGLGFPVFCQEVIPGDTWHVAADHFSRLAPMVAPVYHDFDVKMHWFFVPMRLLWDDFEDWMTGGKTGTWREDNPDSFPLFDLNWITENSRDLIGTVYDFLGINTCSDGAVTVSGTPANVAIVSGTTLPVMPIRGYWLIYNYFFRDQNVTDEVPIPLTSGLDDDNEFLDMVEAAGTYEGDVMTGFFRTSWDKDYFTSATLSPQRGPQVFIPLGNSAPLVSSTERLANVDFNPNLASSLVSIQGNVNGTFEPTVQATAGATASTGSLKVNGQNAKIAATNYATDITNLTRAVSVDLNAAEGAAVDDVREAFALQRFFERMQIVGSRFAEFLRGIWGTNAGDARLQMPEYLGTWRNPFMINNVSNTTGTSDNPQAGYAGNGMSSQYNKPIHKYFPEYGYLYCIYSALPRTGYQQGLAPIFCRRDWLHFANPYFEHVGEQPIEMEELYFDPSKTRAQNEETFGYQSQYASYKFVNSHAHGEFKTSLNFWHANRIFDSKPTLSREFIEYNKEESTDRVFVLQNGPKFYTTIQFDGYVERNLSAYSTPRII